MYIFSKALILSLSFNVVIASLDEYFDLFPELKTLRDSVADTDEIKNKAFEKISHSVLSIFDSEGYKNLLGKVTNAKNAKNFLDSLRDPNFSTPHCTPGGRQYVVQGSVGSFPGGSTNTRRFNLVKWFGGLLSHSKSAAAAKMISGANMALQAFTMVKGAIQTGIAIVTDIVPPMIPPPFWINAPLPCLPMITGPNCLGSVLYPISAPDFVVADITDASMEGVISLFPSKYLAKVGRTSDFQYKLCATAYLGMHCASIFPLCWMPPGISNAATFPLCYVQCLATLVACPGFWIDDIQGPCSDVAIPPFCSFSLFINHSLIPPQYSSFDESHPYPPECPEFDPNFDVPKNLNDKHFVPESPIDKESKEVKEEAERIKWSPYKGCDCKKLESAVHSPRPYPVYRKFTNLDVETHYESPTKNPLHDRCVRICRNIAKIYQRNIIRRWPY